MAEVNIKEAVKEIKESDEESLQKVIEDWFERTRTQGLKLGAQYISAAIFGVISKHIIKKVKPSLRDYKRCIDEIIKIVSVQLKQQDTQQNDSEAEKENTNDGTAETNDNTNS